MSWRIVTAAACLAVVAAPAAAQRGAAVTSAYTNLDLARCRQISAHPEEAASYEWRCPGYGGIPLMVATGDERFDIDARAFNADFETAAMFNEPTGRIEWRLRGGRPFAIIYRLRLFGDNAAPRSILGVETIGNARRPGCLIAWIDGATPNANAVARQQADGLAGTFRCGRDEARRIGDPMAVGG